MEVLKVLVSLSLSPLGFGIIIFAVMALVRGQKAKRHRTGNVPARGTVVTRGFMSQTVRAGSLLVLLAFILAAASVLLRSNPLEVLWWRYSAPLLVGVVVLAVLFVHLVQNRVAPEAPVFSSTPRNWRTFTRPRDLVLAAIALVLTVFTVLAAGAASSPDDNGLYSMLIIWNGDEVAGQATFFGWAYGISVLLAILALAVVLFSVLRTDAVQPFRRPESVAAESVIRRQNSLLISRFAVATMALTLGGSWIDIGFAGTGRSGVGIPGVGNFYWSAGYADFAYVIILAGVVVQTAGVVWLLFGATPSQWLTRTANKPANVSLEGAL